MSFGAVLLTVVTVAVVGGLLYATVNMVPGLVTKPVPARRSKRRSR